MGTVRADNFSDGAGTGAPDFATGAKFSGGFDSTGDAGKATTAARGLVRNVLWERKDLTASGNSDVVIAELTYALTVGDTYRITVNSQVFLNNFDTNLELLIRDNTTTLRTLIFDRPNATGTNTITQSSSFVHTMASTSLNFLPNGASGNAFIQALLNRTFVIVEKLLDHTEGTVT